MTSPTLTMAFGAKPPFIKIGQEGFHINGQATPQINLKIHDYTFMRKLFSAGKMTCYSMDATTAKDGKCCALCNWNYTCTKVIRLMVMIQSQSDPLPAILDVNDASLENLAPILDQLPIDRLHDTLITATINPQIKGLLIDFQTRF